MESCCRGDLCPIDSSFYTIGSAFKKLVFLLNRASRLFRLPELTLIVYVSRCWLTAVSSQRCFASADPLVLVGFWPISADLLVATSAFIQMRVQLFLQTPSFPQRRTGSAEGCRRWGLGTVIAFSAVTKSSVIPAGLDSVFHLYEPPSGVTKSLNQQGSGSW